MSFRCQACNALQPTYSKPIKLVVETRKKTYPKRYVDQAQKICIDEGGHGEEIVKEIEVCEKCSQDAKRAEFMVKHFGNGSISQDYPVVHMK